MSGPSRQVATASVGVYPDLGNFASELLGALNRVITELEGSSKELGISISSGITDAVTQTKLPDLQIEGDEAPILSSLDRVQNSLGRFADIGSEAIGTVAGAVRDTLGSAITGVGGLLSESLSTAAKVGLGAAGAAAGAVAAQAVGGGLNRALSLNQAEASLRAIGKEGEELAAVMDSAEAGVEGTAFLISEAAAASSGFLSAGIDGGDELVGVLQNISNITAQAPNATFGEMSNIMQRAASRGVVMGDTLASFRDRGIPAVEALADSFGVTSEEIEKMSSQGEISFDDLNNALSSSDLISSAEEMAKFDFGMAFGNLRAAIGRSTEPFWTEVLTGLTNLLPSVIAIVRTFNGVLEDTFSGALTDSDGNAGSILEFFEKLQGRIEGFDASGFFNNFFNVIDKLSGALIPLSGLIIGLSGSFLSRIPLIGAAFTGLTGPVGLFIGIMTAAVVNSEKLQNAFGDLFETVGDVLGRVLGGFSSGEGEGFAGLFESIGDSLANGVERITGFIEKLEPFLHDFISGFTDDGSFASVGEFMEDAFSTIGNAIMGFFEIISDPRVLGAAESVLESVFELLRGVSGSIGGAIDENGGTVETLTTLVAGALNAIDGLITGFATFVLFVSDVLNSDIVQSIGSFIGGLISSIAGNETALKVIGVTIAAFVSALLIAPLIIKAIMAIKFLVKLGAGLVGFLKVAAPLGKKAVFAPLGKAMAGFAKALGAGALALIKLTPVIIVAAAAIGVIAAVVITIVALIGQLLAMDFVSDGIAAILNLIANVITTVSPLIDYVVGIVESVVYTLGAALAYIGGIILENLPQLLESIATALATLFNGVFGSLGQFGLDLANMASILFGGLTEVIDGVAGVLDSSLGGIEGIILAIADVIDSTVSGVVSVIEAWTGNLIDLMVALSTHGYDAAGASLALAAGLSALVLAMTGSGIVDAAGNILESGANVLSASGDRLADFISPHEMESTTGSVIDTIINLGNALTDTNGIIENMPNLWADIAAAAPAYGENIMQGLVTGMEDRSAGVSSTIMSAMSAGILAAQNYANRNPIQIQANVNMPRNVSMPSGAGASGGSGAVNNTFNVSNPDPNVAARKMGNLLRRGF